MNIERSHLGLMDYALKEQSKYICEWIREADDLQWPAPHYMSAGVPELAEGEEGEYDSEEDVHDEDFESDVEDFKHIEESDDDEDDSSGEDD